MHAPPAGTARFNGASQAMAWAPNRRTAIRNHLRQSGDSPGFLQAKNKTALENSSAVESGG
jgi:hypothetical protein